MRGEIDPLPSQTMKVDYYFPPSFPSAASESARRASDLGFDGFFSAETSHDPFLPLAAAAQAGSGLDLGTAIAVAFPRSPMMTAQVSWDLAAISGGNFILGLGTQVKPHIVRRFSGVWDSPGPRLREYVQSLREIWKSFQTGEALSFSGDFYSFSLMTPFFNPGPIDTPDIPVAIAGVNPYLCGLAGEVCDGFHVHPFHTIPYLDEVVIPNIREGAARSGRTLDDVDLITTVFVVTGRTDEEIEDAKRGVKEQIAFYASTPSYRIVLDTHGWDFGDRLNQMSRRGEWQEMADVISDEVLDEVAVVAAVDDLGPAIKRRYGDRVQRVGYYTLAGDGMFTDEEWAQVVAATK